MRKGTSEDDIVEKGEAFKGEDASSAEPSGGSWTPQTKETSNRSFSPKSDPVQDSLLWRLGTRIARPVVRLQRHLASAKPVIQPRKSVVRILEQCPEGYPRLAAFLDSDHNFMLYRRFGFIQARLLLNKQDELRELEYELDWMDKVDEEICPSVLRSRESDEAMHQRRKNLFQAIEQKFQDYAKLLITARDLATFNRPPAQDYSSVRQYFREEAPLCYSETYIYHKEDLVTLKSGRESAWLDATFSKVLRMLPGGLSRHMFSPKDLQAKADPKATGIILYSRERVDFAVSVIITLIILSLLMIPVYILWETTRSPESERTTGSVFAVLTAFTLLFAFVLAILTRAKRHEIFASSAAYCAVLVVFMSNVGQLSSKTGN